VRVRVDIILTAGNKAIEAAKKTTTSVPIVMAWSNDPVGRPGSKLAGNDSSF